MNFFYRFLRNDDYKYCVYILLQYEFLYTKISHLLFYFFILYKNFTPVTFYIFKFFFFVDFCLKPKYKRGLPFLKSSFQIPMIHKPLISPIRGSRPVFSFLRKFYFILFYKNNFVYPKTSCNWHLLANMYIYPKKIRILQYNLELLYSRWVHIYWLFWHFYYYNTKLLFFGNKEFAQELTAMNWLQQSRLWVENTYTDYWFTFKTNRYNRKVRLFFKQLIKKNIFLLIFINFYYHFRLINFLKNQPFLTIGLLPLNFINSFFLISVFVFELNFYIQFYFLYFCLFVKKHTLFLKYTYYLNSWFNIKLFLLNSNKKKLY